ncbi:PREDICTED: MLO-like protein 6 [Lupinus angustifolius]|uniref:MLO-like protein 6 n=1 Tax=Lupinus angustifolius TaxID=3871 RepID=UPI00092EA058|nr:PREDICTED: MLO-like protein 6 [Lupinus angustifolius]
MAGGIGGRNLEQTPTWAVAVVCFVLISISITIEHTIHLIGKWLTKKNKRSLYESLEKIKSELMLLGFISLLLTIGQSLISKICISEKVARTWHPCSDKEDHTSSSKNETNQRRLIATTLFFGLESENPRRVLAGGGSDKCGKGKVPFVSTDGIHQLHRFIFVLAGFHVLYCILTLTLGRAKMRRWKQWEEETKTLEYQFSHDPERFRFARDTSFGRRHLSFWTKNPLLIWIVCFFRQFVRSVPKVDYLTLRHGFITAHLAPQSQQKFDFRKYIKRSLEEDFKVVVGISPLFWFFAVMFLLFNTHGWYSYLWLPFIPLIIILLVGTKLQVIITKMALSIQQRGEVLKGMPLVQLGDHLFWFNRPSLILHLINFVLFQNAFQLAFFAWTSFEFGIKSCYHSHTEDVVIRISMGVLIQILCSYVTLPLYALVTQMGSSMKASIFNERIAMALRNWHHRAKKHKKQNRNGSLSMTPISSRATTPTHSMSPTHLLSHYRSQIDSSYYASPRRSIEIEDSPSTSYSYHHKNKKAKVDYFFDPTPSTTTTTSTNHHEIEMDQHINEVNPTTTQHEIVIAHHSKEFSFDKGTTQSSAQNTSKLGR